MSSHDVRHEMSYKELHIYASELEMKNEKLSEILTGVRCDLSARDEEHFLLVAALKTIVRQSELKLEKGQSKKCLKRIGYLARYALRRDNPNWDIPF